MTFVVVWLDVVDESGEEEAVARFIDVVVPVYGMVVSLLTNRDVVHNVPLTWEVVPVTFVVVWFDVVDEPGEEEAVVGFIDVVVPVY